MMYVGSLSYYAQLQAQGYSGTGYRIFNPIAGFSAVISEIGFAFSQLISLSVKQRNFRYV